MSGRKRHQVATSEELDDASRVIADIRGREIAVFSYDGEYYAVANHCIHQAGPLCEGELQATREFSTGEDGWEWRQQEKKQVIVCPWHAWRFDITTGESVDDDRYAVPTYETEVEDGQVFVIA
ncbi:(2Fe-2S)-binding protein [Halobacteriales archaeon QH_10_67_13]|nr:MAG: (2Fe-2S)-binding protein [Halobacteriales archaeon QH_10_67_13]